MKMRLSLLFALATASVSGTGFAQGTCTLNDTFVTCGEKILAAANKNKAESIATADSAIAEELATRNTGTAQAIDSGNASTFNDFFSTFKAAADAATGESADSDNALGFEFSHCLRQQTEESVLQCQGRVRIGGATLYEPLKQALPVATRDQRAKELEDELSFGDSMTVGIFFNLVGEKYGRVPRFGTERLFLDLHDFVDQKTRSDIEAANGTTTGYIQVRKKVQSEINRLQNGASFDDNTKFSAVASFDPVLANQILSARVEDATTELKALSNYRQSLINARYFDLVDLVNNQAQLNFGVEYAQRDALAGPDEWRAKLVYEGGFVNVSTAHKFVYGGDCDGSKLAPGTDTEAAKAAGCLAQYLDNKRVRAQLKNGSRYLLSAEFISRKAFSVGLPTDNISFSQDSEQSLVAKAAYGRYLDFDNADEPRSRVDIEGSYEDVRSDPARQDRGVLTATYSQKVMGSTVLSISLVYGTKPEFRGDVDEEISAHVGLNYKWGKRESF
jgi:hypothetical protein